jgi:hypothetical protein
MVTVRFPNTPVIAAPRTEKVATSIATGTRHRLLNSHTKDFSNFSSHFTDGSLASSRLRCGASDEGGRWQVKGDTGFLCGRCACVLMVGTDIE